MKAIQSPEDIAKLLGAPRPELLNTLIPQIAATRTLLEGHFQLLSGKHTRYFIRFAGIGYDSKAVDGVAETLVESARRTWKATPSAVLAAESASVLLARAVSDKLKARLAVAAIDSSRKPMKEYRFGAIHSNEPVLIVSDVITTGASLAELLKLCENPVGAVAFSTLSVDNVLRIQRKTGVPIDWLTMATWSAHDSQECPDCRNGDGEPLLPASEFN